MFAGFDILNLKKGKLNIFYITVSVRWEGAAIKQGVLRIVGAIMRKVGEHFALGAAFFPLRILDGDARREVMAAPVARRLRTMGEPSKQ